MVDQQVTLEERSKLSQAKLNISTWSNLASPTASMSSLASVNQPVSAPWWSFDAYARTFLVERRAIEKEKEEWENKLIQRYSMLEASAAHYSALFNDLNTRASEYLCDLDSMQAGLPKYQSALSEISQAKQKVSELRAVQRYFQRMALLLQASGTDADFEDKLRKGDWRAGLEAVVSILGAIDSKADAAEPSSLEKKAEAVLSQRLTAYYAALRAQVVAGIQALGWPSIKNVTQDLAELVTRLQDLFTYGEAAYLLAQRLNVELNLPHPIEFLLAPIRERFNYHFSAPDRPTNRLEHPEWYFAHLQKQLKETVPFATEFVFSCWRLRGLDDFINDGFICLAAEKTAQRLKQIEEEEDGLSAFDRQSLVVRYLTEIGRFESSLRDEYGHSLKESLESLIFKPNLDAFISAELGRVKQIYTEAMAEFDVTHWQAKRDAPGEPSAIVLRFMGLFHATTIVPYSGIKDMTVRAELLYRVQSWLLESFYHKCQFESPPQHNTPEQLLQDIGLVNSLALLSRVLRDDWGESLESLELAASSDLHRLVGHDPSVLPGTIFNKALGAFEELKAKLLGEVFDYMGGCFVKPASVYANSMYYYKTDMDMKESFMPMSDQLLVALASLWKGVDFVREYIAPALFSQQLAIQLIDRLAAYFWQSVLLRNFFHASGAERFARDIEHVSRELAQKVAAGDEPVVARIHQSFGKLKEACRLLQIKERDGTAPFDAMRLGRALKESSRGDELRRFLEVERFQHLRVEDLSCILASRRHE